MTSCGETHPSRTRPTTLRRIRGVVLALFVLLLAAGAFAGVARAGADADAPPPSISSDKADYAPGETVTLSGSNWAPEESVHIVVNDDAGQTWRRDVDVTADADGHVSDQFTLPDWFVAVYSVSATGAQSGTATTTFTDGNVTLHLATGEGVASMTVAFDRFDGTNAAPNNNCSGTPTLSSTLTVTSGGTANIPGFGGSNDSLRLGSVTTPTTSRTFDKWTSGSKNTDSGTDLPGTPTPCISNGSGGTNGNVTDAYAHFKDANQDPTANAGGPYTVAEGGSGALSGSGSDSDGDPLAYEWDLDNNGTFETPGQNPSFSAASIDGPATRTVTLRVSDGKGGSATSSATVNVTNVAPTATFTAPASVSEGSSIALSLTSPSDPSSADSGAGFTYAFDCGSGYGPFGSASSASCPTDDNGSRTVKGKIRDKDGGVSEYTASVAIQNAAPTGTLGNNGPVAEGSSVSVSFTGVSDPSSVDAASLHYAFDCAGGSLAGVTYAAAGTSSSTSCTFDDDGSFSVSGAIIDKDGGRHDVTTTVAVANVAPTASFGDDGPVDEGSSFHLSLADADDVSAADRAAGFTYAFDCGDGSGYGAFGSAASATCVTSDDGSRSVKGKVRDKDGAVSEYTGTVVVRNVAPTVLFTAGPMSVSEDKNGSELYSFSVTDPGADDFTVKSGFPECGTGGVLVAGSLATTASGGSFRCRFADGPASTTVRVQVVDADEPAGSSTADSNVATRDVTVANVVPTVNLTGPSTADEGDTNTYSFTLSDPGDDTFSFPSAYPDCGAYGELVGSPTVAGGSFQCRFPDGPHTTNVAVKVADDDGGVSSPDVEQVDIIPVAVANVAPEATAPADQSADEGESGSYGLGSFTDPGSDSPWAVDVDWGDGSSEQSFQETAVGAIAAKSHAYADNGAYTVIVTVTDKDGAADSATFTVTIANVAPTVTLSGAASANEGDTVSYSYAWTDPGSADTFPAAGNAVDCGPNGTVSDEAFTPASKSGSFKCTFSDDSGAGTFAVTAAVADDDGGLGSDTQDVSVANVAPSVSLGGATEVTEGTTHTYSFTVSDPGDDDFSVVSAACGDSGTYEVGSLVTTSLGGSFACSFADGPASSDVTVKVEDSDGASDADSEDVVIVQVANVAPAVTAPADQSSNEGESRSFSFGSFTDPGSDSPWTVDVDWGDGASESFQASAGGPLAPKSHTYDDNGAYTVTVTVTDKDHDSDAKTFQVTVANVAPTAIFGNDGPVDEGSSFHLGLADGDDVSAADRAAGFTYAFDCGSGYGAFAGSANATCPTSDDGVRSVGGKIRDKDGSVTEYTATVTVDNVAPSVSAPANQSADEGENKAFELGGFIDTGADSPWAVDVDWGDGSTHTIFSVTMAATLPGKAHSYADNGTYPVTVTVTDKDHASGSKTFLVSVANVKPSVAPPGDDNADEGVSRDFGLGSFSDPGADSPWAVDVNWGDGSPHYTATKTSTGALGLAPHAYGDNGSYLVTVEVTDKDGAGDTQSFTVTVRNVRPTATFSNTGPIDEGESFTLSLTDPQDVAADVAAGFTYRFDCGDGSGYGPSGSASSKSCPTSDNGARAARAEITDKDGGAKEHTATVIVKNVVPTATFSAAGPVDEGQSFTLSLSGAHDVSSVDQSAGFEYAFDCGAGYGSFGPAASRSCPTADNAVRSVKGKVKDKDGGVSEYSDSVTVSNVAPKITSFTGTNHLFGPMVFGAASTFTTLFADPGTADTWFADFWWQDGSQTTNHVQPFVSGQNATHTFGSAGCKWAKVQVTDDDGGKSDIVQATVGIGTGSFLPPMTNQPVTDKLKNGQVLPVKIKVTDCNGNPVSNLAPQIRLNRGDLTNLPDDSTVLITPESVSAADTSGVMRSNGDGSYIYNMRVSVPSADVGKDYTVIVYPDGVVSSTAQTLRHVVQAVK